MSVERIWCEFQTTKSDSLKHELIVRYLPLVKLLAGRLAVRLPSFVNQEDLESYGVFGLIEAVEKFNPEQGASFKSYASKRIHGSIVDELRKHNWVPRSIYRKLKEIDNVRSELEQREGGTVAAQDLADELGMDLAELHALSGHRSCINVLSLEKEFLKDEGDGAFISRFCGDETSPDPLVELIEKEESTVLAKKISELKDKERVVLALYYQEGLTLKEIGRVLEVSESRVCQMHAHILEKLRRKMRVAYQC